MNTTVPRMNDEQARTWLALVNTSELLPVLLDEQLHDDAGIISFEYGLLGSLVAAENHRMRIGQLAQVHAAPYPRVSKAVSRLEKNGYVVRTVCPEDGRAVNAELTREGRKQWLKATPPHIELARDEILSVLDEEQQKQLADLLEPIITAVKTAYQRRHG